MFYMFIRRKKNKSGSISIQIISKLKGHYKVIKTIGCATMQQEIKRLEQKAKLEIQTLENQGQLALFESKPDELIKNAKKTLADAGLELVEHDIVIASKEEAKDCFAKYKKMDDLDAVILFSGTWVWAAHLVAAIRDFSFTGKGILLWTQPGSRGWRPVGGLVLHGGLKEIGIKHRFIYGSYDDPDEIDRIVSYCRASREKNLLNMSTIGVFGGRGMGQTCGVADPSQWMKVFGVDIDSRDTTELLNTAKTITENEINAARDKIQTLFSEPVPTDEASNRSIRLYLAIKRLLEEEK